MQLAKIWPVCTPVTIPRPPQWRWCGSIQSFLIILCHSFLPDPPTSCPSKYCSVLHPYWLNCWNVIERTKSSHSSVALRVNNTLNNTCLNNKDQWCYRKPINHLGRRRSQSPLDCSMQHCSVTNSRTWVSHSVRTSWLLLELSDHCV